MFINKFFGTKSFLVVAPFFLACLVILPTLEQSIRPILGSSFTRLDLLAYTWDFPQSVILAILATAFMATLFGSYILLKTVGKPKIFVGMTLLALGLSLPHVVVSPPFEAPDEPDHFRGLIRDLPNRPNHMELEKSAAELSMQGQFTRIYVTWDAKLQPEDLLRKSHIPWMEHMAATNMEVRSPFTKAIWMMVNETFGFRHANGLLLCVRLLGCVLFCLVIGGVSSVVTALMTSEISGVTLGLFLLMVPALPFFAMHVSNYSFLTGLYIIAALMCPLSVRILQETNISVFCLQAFIFGALAPVVVVGSPSALAFLAFPLCWGIAILIGKLAFGILHAIVCFAAICLGIAAFIVISAPNLVALPAPITRWVYQLPPLFFTPFATAISMASISVAIIVCLVTLRYSAARGSASRSVTSIRVSYVIHGIIVAFALTISLWPYIGHYEAQPNIEIRNNMSEWMYIRSSVKKYFINYSSLHSDLYLCSSFWTGFGWLEMPTQRSLLMLPKILVPAGFLIGAARKIRLCRKGLNISGVSGIMAVATFIGAAIAIALLASNLYPSVNLHGRYLIGVEIALIVASSTYLASERAPRAIWGRPHYLIAAACLFKGVTLNFLLGRYF